jgi:hypothetical protein
MRRVALALSLGFALLGCDKARSPVACPAIAAAGMSVHVTNAATGQPVCDANVTATAAGYSERLYETSCVFVGLYERPGTYVVAASRAGFAPAKTASVTLVMGGGPCPHVEHVRVNIALAPES